MRVYYRAVRGARRAAPTAYEATRVVFCCDEMRRQWDRLIGFGVKGYRCSTSPDVNLFTVLPQADGKSVLEATPICFCPFCGKVVQSCTMK